jgi:hypothetical protein
MQCFKCVNDTILIRDPVTAIYQNATNFVP